MAISNEVGMALVSAAKKEGIKPPRLLALVEVETNGKPFEDDGKTPAFLFERHIFYRELSQRAKDKLEIAISLGLAIPHWNRATQYRDEQTSVGRMKLISQARAIDEECADLSASWGLGQTMGFNYPELGLGFKSAKEMVDYQIAKGIDGQIDCMIGEVKSIKIIDALNNGDYKTVAVRYNGAGYAQNQYDTKLASAARRWETRWQQFDVTISPIPTETKPMTIDLNSITSVANGYKTYITLAVGAAVVIANHFGIAIPGGSALNSANWMNDLFTLVLGGTFRSALGKLSSQ